LLGNPEKKMTTENSAASASESTGTLEEAKSAFETILSGKPLGKQKDPETEDEATASEDDAEPETQETASEDDEADDAEDEGSDDEQETEEDEKDEEKPILTIEIDGKSVELSKSEIQSSYLRQADYTRKTQALAEERRQFSSELDQAKEDRQLYAQLLPAIVQQLQSSLPQPPDPSLIDIDQARFLKEQIIYERKVGDYKAALSEQERLKLEADEDKSREVQAYVQTNALKLPEFIPEWKDQKIKSRDAQKVREYLKTRWGNDSYTDEQINQAYDAKMVTMAYEAMRWRELKNSKPRPDAPLEKSIRTSPPPSKPQTAKTKAFVEAKKRLKQTGSLRDAASVFESLI
jgi:hypothetical protein